MEKRGKTSNRFKQYQMVLSNQQWATTITSRKIRLLNSSTGIQSQTLFDYIQ
jgi:hypothetical protein